MFETIFIFLLKAVTVVAYCVALTIPLFLLYVIIRALLHRPRRPRRH
jgi:hypothetical protein